LETDGVKISEITEYPFRDTVKFVFSLKGKRRIDFNLRIPGWCKDASVLVNGEKWPLRVKKGFAEISRDFENGDTIVLNLPSEIKVCSYHKQCVYVEKGALVYSYGMYGKREKIETESKYNDTFPTYNIYPDKEWNYALCTGEESVKKIRFVEKPIEGNPWDIRYTPNKIFVPAKKVNGWELEKHKRIKRFKDSPLVNKNTEILTGQFTFTPELPSKAFIEENGLGKEEMIELVPYACAKLRLTLFPDAGRV
jgi:hypothetical protein